MSQSQESINRVGFNEDVYSTIASSGGTSLSSFYDNTPSSSNRNSISLNDQHVLHLNEETNTWKISTKKKRRANMRHGRKQIQSTWMKLKDYIRQENASELRFRITVVAFSLVILILIFLTRYYYNSIQISIAIKNQIFVHKNENKITFLNKKGDNLLHLVYGKYIPSDIEPVNCLSVDRSYSVCLDWRYRARFSVKKKIESYETFEGEPMPVVCYTTKWQSYQKYTPLKDCFDMNDSFW